MAKLNIDEIFTYHRPFGDQPQRYEAIRGLAKALGNLIQQSTPPSREQSLAFTHLQESVMFANAAIAINEVEIVVPSQPQETV